MQLSRTSTPSFLSPIPYRLACTRYVCDGPWAFASFSVELSFTYFQSMVAPSATSHRSMLPLMS